MNIYLLRLFGHASSKSTYQFSCENFPSEEVEAYLAENTLVRSLDKHIDEQTHIPLERCYGKAVSGEFCTSRISRIFFFKLKITLWHFCRFRRTSQNYKNQMLV